MTETKAITGIKVFLVVLAAFCAFGFFYVTLIPHFQGKSYLAVTDNGTPQDIVGDTFAFYPDSNAQGLIRTGLLGAVFTAYNQHELTAADPVPEFATAKIQEYVAKHPYYYEDYLALAKAYDVEADLNNEPSLYVTAEGYYKKALAIIPGRQDVVYAYALNLLHQKRPADAIALLEASLAAAPNVAETHYELAQALAVQGPASYDASLDQFEFSFAHGDPNLDPSLTLDVYRKFIVYYYDLGDLPRFETVVERLVSLDPAQDAGYATILDYIKKNGTMPIVNLQQQ